MPRIINIDPETLAANGELSPFPPVLSTLLLASPHKVLQNGPMVSVELKRFVLKKFMSSSHQY